MLPRHAFCALSRLRCNGHSLLLSSYLSRIGRIENPSCSGCGHSSQYTSHLILHCRATDSLRRSLFGDSLSLYNLWSRPWGVARLLGLHGLPAMPPSLGRGRVTTITTDIRQMQTTKMRMIRIKCNETPQGKNVSKILRKWTDVEDIDEHLSGCRLK